MTGHTLTKAQIRVLEAVGSYDTFPMNGADRRVYPSLVERELLEAVLHNPKALGPTELKITPEGRRAMEAVAIKAAEPAGVVG